MRIRSESTNALGQPSETMPTLGGLGSCFSMSLARQIGVPAPFGERGAVLQRDPGTISMMTSPACRAFASASQKPKQRAEERRVGKAGVGTCRSRWSTLNKQKTKKKQSI